MPEMQPACEEQKSANDYHHPAYYQQEFTKLCHTLILAPVP
jgi:hypothetical protein